MQRASVSVMDRLRYGAGGRRTVAQSAVLLAIVRIRADEHAAAAVVGDYFVEVAVGGAANLAGCLVAIGLEWVILEVERHHARIRRNGVDALFAAGTEQLQCWTIVQLRIVEFRDRGGV